MSFELKQNLWHLRRKMIGAGLAVSALLPRIVTDKTRGQSVIFTLHHVRPYTNKAFEPSRHLEITPEFLDEALTTISEAGYEFTRLQDLKTQMAARPDAHFAAFTLDDGYKDNALYAAPIFEKHNAPFTIFITEGFAQHEAPIWWVLAERIIASQSKLNLKIDNETCIFNCKSDTDKYLSFYKVCERVHNGQERSVIKALSDKYAELLGDPIEPTTELVMNEVALRGLLKKHPLCDFGAHTVTHPNMVFLTEDEFKREVVQSRDFVSSLTNASTNIFAYPYGLSEAISLQIADRLAEQGFDIAVTTRPGTVVNDDFIRRPRMLPRVSLNGYYQKPSAVRGLMSGFPFLLHR